MLFLSAFAVKCDMSHTFVLQFHPSEISRLAAQYGPEQDEEAFGREAALQREIILGRI